MYEVFVNERPIILTNKLEKESSFKYFMLETVDVNYVIKQLDKGKIKAAYLYHPDDTVLLSTFKKKIPTIIAAGGVVHNPKGEILFIHRNGKWDLAKGKLDKGEKVEDAAVREVEEETGIKKLVIEKLLYKTYHIFKRNGKFKLKETYWYTMKSSYTGKFTPQLDEGITEVCWKNEAEIEEALKNSYSNIKKLFKKVPHYSEIK